MKESEYNEIIAALRAAEETIRQLRDELKKWQTTRCQCIKTQIEEETGINERQKNLPSTCGECGQKLA